MHHDLDRERYRRLFPDPPRAAPAVAGASAFVGKVATASPVVNQFMLVTPADVTGAETEGGPGALTLGSGSVPVLPIGPLAPAQNDYVVCRFVGHRWVCEKCGASTLPGHPLPGCPCVTVPGALFMHVQRQPPGHVESVVYPDSLTYQARPASLAVYRSTDPGWYGSGEMQSSDFFYRFIYWFGCSQGSYFVGGLLTPDSPLGYPGFFLIASFLIGLPGNTCSPFELDAPASATPTFQQQGISITGAAPPPPGRFTSSVVVPPRSVVSPVFRSRR